MFTALHATNYIWIESIFRGKLAQRRPFLNPQSPHPLSHDFTDLSIHTEGYRSENQKAEGSRIGAAITNVLSW